MCQTETVLEQVKAYLKKTKRLKTLAALENRSKFEQLSFKILKPPNRKKHEISKIQNSSKTQKITKTKNKSKNDEKISRKFRKVAKLFGIPEEHLEFFYENRSRFSWNIKEKPKVQCTEQHCKYTAEFKQHSLDEHMIAKHNYKDIQCQEPNCTYLAYSQKSFGQHKARFHGTGSRNSNLRFDHACRYSNCSFSAKCDFLLQSGFGNLSSKEQAERQVFYS